MTNKFLLLISMLFIFSCSKDNFSNQDNSSNQTLWAPSEIDNHILEAIKPDAIWNWENGSDQMIYSALMHSDSILSVGFNVLAGQDVSEIIGTDKMDQSKMHKKRDELISFVLEQERNFTNNPNLKEEEILPFGKEEVLPSVEFLVTDPAIITEFRARPDIRYVEPMGYYLQTVAQDRSSSGCDLSPDYGISSSDYTTISPNTKVPWNFYKNDIPSAWNCSKGDNIGICIIDTGAADSQDNLGSQFTSGQSGGRYIQKYSTHESGWWW